MKKLLRDFIYEQEAMGTVEVVLIAAILMGLAFMFNKGIREFMNAQLSKIKNATFTIDTN